MSDTWKEKVEAYKHTAHYDNKTTNMREPVFIRDGTVPKDERVQHRTGHSGLPQDLRPMDHLRAGAALNDVEQRTDPAQHRTILVSPSRTSKVPHEASLIDDGAANIKREHRPSSPSNGQSMRPNKSNSQVTQSIPSSDGKPVKIERGCGNCAGLISGVNEVFDNKGHSTRTCTRNVGADGYIDACPWCNVRTHNPSTCPEPKTLANAYHFLVQCRNGKAPFRCHWDLRELLPERWDKEPFRPQTPAYTLKRLAERGVQDIDNVDHDPIWQYAGPDIPWVALVRWQEDATRLNPPLDPIFGKNVKQLAQGGRWVKSNDASSCASHPNKAPEPGKDGEGSGGFDTSTTGTGPLALKDDRLPSERSATPKTGSLIDNTRRYSSDRGLDTEGYGLRGGCARSISPTYREIAHPTFYGGPEDFRQQPHPPQYQCHSQSYIPQFGGTPTLSDHEIEMRVQSVEARRIQFENNRKRLRAEELALEADESDVEMLSSGRWRAGMGTSSLRGYRDRSPPRRHISYPERPPNDRTEYHPEMRNPIQSMQSRDRAVVSSSYNNRLQSEFEESRNFQDVMDSARRATYDRDRPRGRSASPIESNYSSSLRSESRQSGRSFAGRRGGRGGRSGGGQRDGKGRT